MGRDIHVCNFVINLIKIESILSENELNTCLKSSKDSHSVETFQMKCTGAMLLLYLWGMYGL